MCELPSQAPFGATLSLTERFLSLRGLLGLRGKPGIGPSYVWRDAGQCGVLRNQYLAIQEANKAS